MGLFLLLDVCSLFKEFQVLCSYRYRGADKSLARPGRKQARKHVRDARDFNNIETRAVIKFFFLQGRAQKGIHAILIETLVCFILVGLRTYQHHCTPKYKSYECRQ